MVQPWTRATILLALIGVTACHSIRDLPRELTEPPSMRPPRPAGYPIALTDHSFLEAHHPIGVARSRVHPEYDIDVLGPEDLRREARRMGGDAVVDIRKEPLVDERITYRPGALLRMGSEFVVNYQLVGTVVEFERPVLLPPPLENAQCTGESAERTLQTAK